MKCPERFIVAQRNIRKSIINEENIVQGEYHILLENQNFEECYKEKCAAWDSVNERCKKF